MVGQFENRYRYRLMHYPPSTIHDPQGQPATPPAGFPDPQLQAQLPELRRIAVELFGEPVTVETECDAEVDDDWYVVFSVVLPRERASASLSLRREWYQKTWPLLGRRSHLLRLAIGIR